MSDIIAGEDSPEARKSHLESDVLHLKGPDFNFNPESTYRTALITQALPVVNLLAEIKDAGVNRKNLIIADFSSEREGGSMLHTKDWDLHLQAAISDLARAAGINISYPKDETDNSEWKLPEYFKGLFNALELPPALSTRIESRRAQTIQELDAAISENKLAIRGGQSRSFARNIPGIGSVIDRLERRRESRLSTVQPSPTPDYFLQIDFEYDYTSARRDPRRPQFEYTRLNHRISLVSPSAPS